MVRSEPAEPAQPLQPQRGFDRLRFWVGAGEDPLRQLLRAGVIAGRGRGLGGALQQGDLVDAGDRLRVRQVLPPTDGEGVLGERLGGGVRSLRRSPARTAAASALSVWPACCQWKAICTAWPARAAGSAGEPAEASA